MEHKDLFTCCYVSEAATGGALQKKGFLEILQNSQENTCARVSFFNKIGGLRPATLLKRDFGTGVFFYRTPSDDCFSCLNFVVAIVIEKQ